MIERPCALEERRAGLADGLKTVAPDTGSLPRGGITGEAQSEREKRDPRHGDDDVSQVALNDPGMVTPLDRPMRRLGSGQQDRGGIGTSSGRRLTPGLVVLCLPLKLSPTSNTL